MTHLDDAAIEAWRKKVSLDMAPQWPTVNRDHLEEAVAMLRTLRAAVDEQRARAEAAGKERDDWR